MPQCDLVIDSRPALSLINSNIKKQLKKILKDSLVQDAYDEMLETSHNENNSNGEEQQPEPKEEKNSGTDGVLDLTRKSIIPKRLRTVVDGVTFGHRNVLNGNHNEDWYRVNVYGDVFDFIFNGQAGYETKRSECHSSIVKSLRNMGLLDANTKDVRLVFIFTNSSGLNDAFYCEDKPYERASKDNEKTRHLREQVLNYWKYLLPYNECIEYITCRNMPIQ
ncbi:uncharacterized protein EV154DRAFT_556475 [Mucor mucedo]|uniref:uncharacterized protein n=1 Tax=Mucor mucedo TaxID=29922 RepID=UPI00221EC58A|nr:uncharacterized protein EV154DRAFT_556475 [Mucor mucedo]KAI7872257.1 hypothetical protein EV154DRAFT_556475 [Mucor mucedo]